ncbi:hypothetical protein Hanom_Chr10g00895441 [Helianthus anomalus]
MKWEVVVFDSSNINNTRIIKILQCQDAAEFRLLQIDCSIYMGWIRVYFDKFCKCKASRFANYCLVNQFKSDDKSMTQY